MHRKLTIIFGIILLLSAATTAVWADEVDDYVKAEMSKRHIPGLSLAVIKDGKIIKAKGYGLANVELNVSASPETVYKIGSVSKQFIASGIMLLIKDGKISLEDKIVKFLDGAPDPWKDITVRHLLTHTSGLVREAPGFEPFQIKGDAEVIKTAYSLPLRFAPGEKWDYCNFGYFILAEIVSKVSGKSWFAYLSDRVFGPLGMNATRTTSITDLVENRADGYAWKNGRLQNSQDWFALRPSGAFLSSVLDLAKWDSALYTDKILEQSIREQMWTPVKLNDGTSNPYGFGWMVEPINGHMRLHHEGSLPGFRAQVARFVGDKLSVIILTNSDDAKATVMSTEIAALYVPNLIPTRVAVRVDPKVFDTYVGQYQSNLSSVLKVTSDNGKLILQEGANAEKQELVPETEANFFTRDNRRLTYSFVKDENGRVTDLVLGRDGLELWRAKKLK